MPRKPGKYGIKTYAVADARTYYCYNFELHVTKQHDGPYKLSYSPADIVLRLTENFTGSGRTVTTDNYYTSLELAKKLLDRNLNLLGTVR